MIQRIAIGMSGGVDSSVAAAVLKQQGYDVVGVTMRLWDGENIDGLKAESACCSVSAVEDARRVAEKLSIEHHVIDFRSEFSEFVIDYFVNEYINGRTPNPCIACNKFLKFGALAEEAALLRADKLATGHYARVGFDDVSGRYLLNRAASFKKDQTYALYSLTQDQLSRLMFPLGEFLDKKEVRKYADRIKLETADKPDSQEICFVPDKDYAAFIKRRIGNLPEEGNFVDLSGNVLGRHKGIVNYTVGQRKGLGIAFGLPMFVVKIDAARNEIVLGEQGTEFSDILYAVNPNLISVDKISEPIRADAKVRYSAKPAGCMVFAEDSKLRIEFDEPQRAITPGQAVVIYDGDTVVGGATIERAANKK